MWFPTQSQKQIPNLEILSDIQLESNSSNVLFSDILNTASLLSLDKLSTAPVNCSQPDVDSSVADISVVENSAFTLSSRGRPISVKQKNNAKTTKGRGASSSATSKKL